MKTLKKTAMFMVISLLVGTMVVGCGGGSSKKNNSKNPDPPGVTTSLPFIEKFDTVTLEQFWTAEYKALASNPAMSMYYKTGGEFFALEDGQLTIRNGRFTIGQTKQESKTTTASNKVDGDFNFTANTEISFRVVSAETNTTDDTLIIYLDNNSAASKDSPHGGNSQLASWSTANLTPGQVYTATTGTLGTSSSFIQIRVSGSDADGDINTIVIDDLYIGAPGGRDAALGESSGETPALAAKSLIPTQKITGTETSTFNAEDIAYGGTAPLTISAIVTEPDAAVATATWASGSVTVTGVATGTTNVVVTVTDSAAPAGTVDVTVPIQILPELTATTAIPFIETFDTADKIENYTRTQADGITKMYRKTGGTVTAADDQLTISSGRFTIGDRTGEGTAKEDTTTHGDFDLSKAYNISFNLVSTEGSSDTEKTLQVYVDNNSTGQSNSYHGSSSLLLKKKLSELTVGETVIIPSSVGTATSFIQIRTETGAVITIDDLKIEYQ